MALQTGLDCYDQELMDNFKALSPLLIQARAYQRSSEEERLNKRFKPEEQLSPVKQEDSGAAKEVLDALKLMAQLLLAHERSLQLLAKQDSYVLFISNSAQGALPLLDTLSTDWKQKQAANQGKQTLRTCLLQGLIKELAQRVTKLSQSKAGDQLWDMAVQRGTLRADGSWPYQKWQPEEQKLVAAARPPLSMTRLLKALQYLEELLEESHHVIRFHNLRPQTDMTPWHLQISMRDSDVWTQLNLLTQSSVWILLGMQVKQHSQTMSKPAQNLQQVFGKGGTPSKGQGKGKKGKTKKTQ